MPATAQATTDPADPELLLDCRQHVGSTPGSTHPVPDACDVLNALVLCRGAVGVPLMIQVATEGVAPGQVNGPGEPTGAREECDLLRIQHHHASGHYGKGDGWGQAWARRARAAVMHQAWL